MSQTTQFWWNDKCSLYGTGIFPIFPTITSSYEPDSLEGRFVWKLVIPPVPKDDHFPITQTQPMLRFCRAIAGRHHHNRGFRGNNQRGKKWVKKGAAWMHQISWDIIQMPFRCRSGAIRTPSELKHFHSVQLCLATLRNRKLTRRSWTAPWFLTSLYSRVCFGQWPGIFDMVRACQSWPAKQIPPWSHPLWPVVNAMICHEARLARTPSR